MAKDKKKKKDKKGTIDRATGGLKALAKNPLAADIVAAALVATASALKDSRRAQALANDAGDELARLSKAGARQGEALWDMALQIGRRSLEALAADQPLKSAKRAKPKSKTKTATKPAKSKPKSSTKKTRATKPASAGKR